MQQISLKFFLEEASSINYGAIIPQLPQRKKHERKFTPPKGDSFAWLPKKCPRALSLLPIDISL
ncbi:Uncharacterised protein [uncultured archaeon]|nr:Uncharacterised protein [uncultured archaeon]